MKKFKYLLFAFLILSCSAEKRLNRLIKRNPHLLERQLITYRDTIHDTVKITIPEVKTEKVFSFEQLRDTVYIDTAHLNVKIWTNATNDTVFVAGKCDSIETFVPVAIPIEVEIPVEKIIYRKPRDRLTWFFRGLLTGFISFLVLAIYFKRIKSRSNT